MLTETMASDSTGGGIVETKTAGENLAFGDPVYFKSDGKVWKADADGSGTFPCRGIALGTIAANGTGSILRQGTIRLDSWSWTIGGTIYLSKTAGLTQTQPSATDDVIQVLGVAHPNADTIDFYPSPDVGTHI